MHKFRCSECAKFFGKQKKMNSHYKLCKKKELKENKIKCSECDLLFDDVESMSIHFCEKHDKKKQNNTENKNISQKAKILLKK